MKVTEARVTKSSNSGVGLYIGVRGTYDEVVEEGPTEAKRIAQALGWNPDGRGRGGFAIAYGVDIYERFFTFDSCLCHDRYGCEAVTGRVVYGGGFSGSESPDVATDNLRRAGVGLTPAI